MRDQVKNTIMNLERNGFAVRYAKNKDEAKAYLMEQILEGKSVAFGGSVTLEEIGLYEALTDRGNKVFWHWKAKPGDPKDRKDIMSNARLADLYVSGANAITEDGTIVNIDGTGNRLSGMLYGHEHLYIVAGTNKITRNGEEAIIRIKNVSCPKNAVRLGFDTPCATMGKCMNCSSPKRFCNVTLVMERQHSGIPTTVILVDQELGF